MRKIRELLRLKYELGRSHREIATSLGIANSTVSDYVRRARAAGFSWPLPEGLDDAALEAALFPAPPPSRVPRPKPDWGQVHRELQRHKGVTRGSGRFRWLQLSGAGRRGGWEWAVGSGGLLPETWRRMVGGQAECQLADTFGNVDTTSGLGIAWPCPS